MRNTNRDRERLALLGGAPALDEPLPESRTIGAEEAEAVAEVMQSGVLSGFYGSLGPQFFGGPKVQAFEKAWSERFGVRHAVSVNSATSGLIAAVGATGAGPGDEIIVPPWTMSATAVAPLVYGAVPVFADIEAETFCLDPEGVAAAITPRTRAIIAVNLFGHPARLKELRALADARGIFLIEDNAQGLLAEEDGRLAGGIGHIGVFSLNYHKHIHTGEGGICVTQDDRLAFRLQRIRNHGENVVDATDAQDMANLYGFNFRLTEMSAAVGIEQLKRINARVAGRERIAKALSAGIADLEGLRAPNVREGCRHAFYVWGMLYDEAVVGVPRDTFCKALAAEGVPHFQGYVKPLYLLPLFQQRIAMGRHGFPFDQSTVRYDKGLCPVTERLHESMFIGVETCMYDPSPRQVDQLIKAFRKVHALRAALQTQ